MKLTFLVPLFASFLGSEAFLRSGACSFPSTRTLATRPLANLHVRGGSASPFAIVVEAEIVPERVEEFLDVIEKDAVGSRAEEGCLRFDVLRDQSDPNKFFFYEVYVDAAAVAVHKEQPRLEILHGLSSIGRVLGKDVHRVRADGVEELLISTNGAVLT